MKFFYRLNDLTEQILILSSGAWNAQGDHPYQHPNRCRRHPGQTRCGAGISIALSRCLPSGSMSHRRPPWVVPWKEGSGIWSPTGAWPMAVTVGNLGVLGLLPSVFRAP